MTLAIEKQQQKSLTFSAILYWEEDVYVAECPEVGTASQGETIEEAIAPPNQITNSDRLFTKN